MIIKRIPHRRFSSFGCLADDICAPPHDPERIRIFPPRNGLPPAPTTSHPREALVLTLENAHQAWWNLTGLRDQDLTMHLVVSFIPEESNSLRDEDYWKIECQVMESLGLQNHRRISVIHDDTDHRHMHLAVDHLDEQGKFRRPKKMFKRLMDVRRKICEERAWQAR